MHSAGLPQEVTVRPHMQSPSQTQWACYRKWKVEWEAHASVVGIHLWKLLWVFCPGHAGVKGNDEANTLAGKAILTSGLLFRSEVLRSLRHYLQAQSHGHHTVDHLEERGIEGGNARWSSLKGQEGHQQSNEHWKCFKGNVGETSERWGGAHMGFSERIDIILNWTELMWSHLCFFRTSCTALFWTLLPLQSFLV